MTNTAVGEAGHDNRWIIAAQRLRAGAPIAALPTAIPVPEQANAVVVRPYDGDTFFVDVHLIGAHHLEDQPIRLLGCNAAELKTPGGDAAAANLASLLPVGAPVVLSQIGDDKYAPRLDCAVAFLLNGVPTDLVSYLVGEQWLAPWTGVGKKPVPPWPRTVAA